LAPTFVHVQAAYGGPQPSHTLKLNGSRTVTWQAFNVGAFSASPEGRAAEQQMASWVADGTLPNAGREDVVKGTLADLPKTFARMLAGGNNGKQVLELVSSPPPDTAQESPTTAADAAPAAGSEQVSE
jgi:NADPH-dependent curcumin reductase CurA